jgi:zinc protease
MRWKRLTTLSLGLALTAHCIHAQPIPPDPSVHSGRLPNGFTYYIRHNEEPHRHVELYLVNKVGSVLEDDDQRGLAHFMEHMNFNGTRHFPKNELTDYLQRSGVRFGADLNAYTSFDETVYQLPLPTDDPALVDSGLLILRDWAQDATLDSIEIEKERGVVLEEERLGKGARDRMLRQYYPMVLNHSRYADRLPIGKDSILLHFKPATIRRFYHDWYRPDLQALIIVGDIDIAAMEQKVIAAFSGLQNPVPERPRPIYTVSPTEEQQFLAVTDKENTATQLQVLIKHPAPKLLTEADYGASLTRSLFNSMLAARRYAVSGREKDPASVSSGAGIESLMGGMDMLAFEVTARDGQLQKAFDQTWSVIENIRRFGFTQGELDRAKENYLRGMETTLKEIDKTPSVSYVKEYQRLFLQSEASPGIEWEMAYTRRRLPSITLDDIRSVMTDYLNGKDRDILVLAPDEARAALPDAAVFNSWMQSAGSVAMEPFRDSSGSRPLMAYQPKPGKVVSQKTIDTLKVTELTLTNGVRVILKPTAFKNDEVTFRAFGAGGTSLYADSDVDAAVSADKLITSFGVGELNPVQLNAALTGKVVKVAPFISQRAQGVTGTAAPADLETAFQLVYLYFTSPRKDEVLYDNIISRSRSKLPARYADPNNVFSDTIATVMGNYTYRTSPPTLSKLDRVTLDKTYRIYKERFSDASAFTFVFVGNFTVAGIRPLLERYLGSLPSQHRHEQARDRGNHIPPGQLVKNVFKGTEDKAVVRLVLSGDYHYDPAENIKLRALGQILQIRLLEHLREEESEVYAPSVQTLFNKYPANRYALIVSFGCAPRNVDHLVAMTRKEMDTLQTEGPGDVDVEKFKAAYRKELEKALQDNGFWLSYLTDQYENGDDVLTVLTQEQTLQAITSETLEQAARQFLDSRNSIRFALLPESD